MTLHNQPIPWNAESVQVEAILAHLPPGRNKSDFQLLLPGQEPIPSEGLRRPEGDDNHHLFFRLSPPAQTVTAELRWRTSTLAYLTLPMLSRDEFVNKLRIAMPTTFVRLGGQSVACQTFVATQCKGLMASAVLTSPTSLAPLRELGLQVEFRSERSGTSWRVPVPLTSSQLDGRQALVTVIPPKIPRRIGNWTLTWLLAETPLLTQRIKAISVGAFHRSLRVAGTRFVVQTAKEGVQLRRQVPPLEKHDRIGPCFLVASRELGMAGMCKLRVHAQLAASEFAPALLDQEILVTDGPTWFVPGTVPHGELGDASGFELRCNRNLLSTVSLSPAPVATFTCEGGFKPAEEFAWTPTAEEELNERLAKLLEISRGNTPEKA